MIESVDHNCSEHFGLDHEVSDRRIIREDSANIMSLIEQIPGSQADSIAALN